MDTNIGLIVLENAKELGEKINNHLNEINNTNIDYIIPITSIRFSNGEGKVIINKAIREKDIFIISDVGNYSMTYKIQNFENHMSPDDHFQDIKRVISAMNGQAHNISLIMPLLYQSRQHRRKGRESLDCAMALQDLQHMGVDNIFTIDAHDPNIINAIPSISFDNFYPTEAILKEVLKTITNDNLLVISPDIGAMDRARYYADKLKCDVGVFYKRRDVSVVIDGKNPVVEHSYMGSNTNGKNILIVDDMIASGGSMIECAEELKKQGANKVYFCSSFALLSNGPQIFIDAFKKGLFDQLYTTNLSYIPEDLSACNWITKVDCSKLVASIINNVDKKESLGFLSY